MVFTIPGTDNQYTLPASIFTEYKTVYVQVRTQTQFNGWGSAAQGQFALGTTPPLAPVLVYPLGIAVSGINGVLLEWRYNSAYDTTPSGFDIRYRLDGGPWVNKTNTGQLSIMTDPIVAQSTVEWQVMGYGALGDAGPWSVIGTFFTIGIPNAPVITGVTNSNRPTVFFSAVNMFSWELVIVRDGAEVYGTGMQPFLSDFSHQANRLFLNGNYIARMRIANEFGLLSGWGIRPFTINTVPPQAPALAIVDNPLLCMRLHIENGGNLTYVYRSESRRDAYLRIGKTTGRVFDDYTAAPRRKYDYFVRVVGGDYSFTDSDVVTGELGFSHTTLAESDDPQNSVSLTYQLGAKPQKDRSHSFDKALTQFVGREKPVLQIGQHANMSIQLSFYCDLQTRARLERLNKSGKTLILRDWRLGTLYGAINGELTDKPTEVTDGCTVAFVFSETDYDQEVEL